MAYDKNLDKEIWSDEVKYETTKITVSVYSYNEGDKKLQLSRQNMNSKGEWSFNKLGRLTKEEAIAITPLIQKALSSM